MDQALPSNGTVMPGVSIRNGPLQEVDTAMADVPARQNCVAVVKRKGRDSVIRPSYAESEAESSGDEKPLVIATARSDAYELSIVPLVS